MNKIDEIKNLISNKITYSSSKKYCAIIGLNPSKGARSPILWNGAFRANKLDIKMLALDVPQKNLKKLFTLLNEDKFFLGGAITAPYKIKIYKYLKNNVDKNVKAIGAVNCIYRKNNGILIGTNTDGEGAIYSFKKNYRSFKNNQILLFGVGGVGKAVGSYFSNFINLKKNLILFSRSGQQKIFAGKLKTKLYKYNQLKNFYDTADIIINCTDLGSENKLNESVLSYEQVRKFKKKIIVYDVIYNPKKTKLLKFASKLKLKHLNGREMNLYQAILAFNYCISKKQQIKKTSEVMIKIK